MERLMVSGVIGLAAGGAIWLFGPTVGGGLTAAMIMSLVIPYAE